MKGYEIFIAYRRLETQSEAERIYEALLHRGYETFIDTQELGRGNYRDKNLPEIASNTTNYLVIITDKSFEKCFINEDDLFERGIEFALKNGKNIIPVFAKEEASFPSDIPKSIESIRNLNGIKYEEKKFDRFIDKLIRMFLVDRDRVSVSDPSRDFYVEDEKLIEYLGNASTVVIPASIRIISERAFKDKTKVEEIILPDSLEVICDEAFERCIGLINIKIPDSVKRIGNNAFARCYKLSYIKLGTGLLEIGEFAFSYCCKLKWIMLPEKLEKIKGSAFNGCSMLNAIFVEEKNCSFISKDGILYDKDMKSLIRCPENYEDDFIDIEQSVTSILPYAFYRCLNIQQINFPRGIEVICEYSFEGCSNVLNMTLSETIKSFDIKAIEGWEIDQLKFSKRFSPAKKKEILEKLKRVDDYSVKNRDYEFVIIKTTFESIEEAKNMASMLLRFKYIVSGQIHKLESLYLWDNELNDEMEYELACITISSKCDKAMDFINKNHSYETCQILVVPIYEVSEEIANWLYDSLEVVRC